jgi:hypothetical protein
VPWASAFSASTFLVAGCGYIGIRETSLIKWESRFEAEERWYDADTGLLSGHAANSTKGGLTCEGVLPPPDCVISSVCSACAPDAAGHGFRESCDISDLAMTIPGWRK